MSSGARLEPSPALQLELRPACLLVLRQWAHANEISFASHFCWSLPPQHVSALLLLDPACVLALLCFSFLTYTEMHKGDSLCFFKEKQLCSSCPLEPRPACILEPRPACLLEPRPTNNERSLAPHVFWSLAPHVFWSLAPHVFWNFAPQSAGCSFHHCHLDPFLVCSTNTMKE